MEFIAFIVCISACARLGQSICLSPYMFTCSDNTCISKARVCDGKLDCPKGDDESHEKAACGIYYCKLRNLAMAMANGYGCRNSCSPLRENQCIGLQRCICDDECGYSCVNPDVTCPAMIPAVEHAISHEIIRFDGNVRIAPLNPGIYKFGDMIKYRCKQGMTLVGPLPRCTGAQQWTRQLPQCVENHCSSNPCLNGGTCVNKADRYICFCIQQYEGFSCEMHRYNSCRRQQCKNGGTCQTVGRFWHRCICPPGFSGRSCEKEIVCHPPLPPERGYVSENKKIWKPGERAIFHCLVEYELIGRNSIMCEMNGEWSELQGKCIGNICGLDYFLLPENIFVQGYDEEQLYYEKFPVGSSVTMECRDGFIPFRQNISMIPPTIECRYGGRWVPHYDEIYCDYPVTTCPYPEMPEFLVLNGHQHSQFTPGTLLRFHCIADRVIIGPASIVCLPDGRWSEIPRCATPEIGCKLDPEILSGGVVASALQGDGIKVLFAPGEQVHMRCGARNALIFSETDGFTNLTTCTEREEWRPALQGFRCVQTCRWNSDAENGVPVLNIRHGVFFPNQTLYSKCPPLYRHSGSNEIRCLENGTWSSMSTCEPVGCWIEVGELDGSVIISGHSNQTLNGIEFSIGHQLELLCAKDGEKFSDEFSRNITCKGKKEWTSDYRRYRCHPGTCNGRCFTTDGPCACDFECEVNGNCCDDYAEFCEK